MKVAFQRIFGILERGNNNQITPSLSKPHELSYRSNTILSFEKYQSNQYQSRARFYSGGVYSFVYNNEVLGGRVQTRSYELPRRTSEMVKKIHNMVLDDYRLKVRELSNMVGISKSVVHRILTENLDMKKLCTR